MPDKIKHFALMVFATLAFWAAALFMRVITDGGGVTDFGALIAFLATIALWITWGFTQFDSSPQEASEKAKRQASEDARIALLLELMDESERQALKQRLMDDLSGDGEAVSLADLLAADKHDMGERGDR